MPLRSFALVVVCALGASCVGDFVFAAPPDDPAAVAKAIDRAIQQRLDAEKIPASPQADDGEFLRRVYFDVIGRPPTLDEATAFLDDTRQDKRTRLIDELLARPEYGQFHATRWRDLLVDRSSDMNQVRSGFSWEFITWMTDALNADRGWNEIVADLLTVEGQAKTNPASLLLLANRMNSFPKPEDVVGTSSELFLGLQLRCAQCHDHPYVAEWKQDDFWGLAAFFSQLRDHNMDGNGGSRDPIFSEKPIEDPKKATSYVNQMKRLALIPPEPKPQIAVPDGGRPGETLRVVPAKFFLGERPKLNDDEAYRPQFAAWLTSIENPYFAKAAANRTWALLLGVGLVNPIDDMTPENPASHPEVLDRLAREFAASGFSTKYLIRCICNSAAYQRTSRPLPGNAADRTLFSHQAIRLLSPDQMVDAVSIASGRTPPTGKNRDRSTEYFATKDAKASAVEFSHGISQFLYQMNGNGSINPPTYLGKATQGKNVDEAATALYIGVLSRRPTAEELSLVKRFVGETSNSQQAYKDLYWTLVNGAEFYFVH